ncbi:MAG TPA: exodeoxyribonuclease VII large subunit, partial [Verrucomicrobiae bacterium]|nr:exodeoxyribonuclease VII large subunit [Verrucomicrobiae bacterium]
MLPQKTILTVTRFTAILRDTLEENFAHVWIEGEVSNLSSPASGHLYFTLKDAGAQLRCVMFRSTARNLRFRLKDGAALLVMGRVTVYDQRGEYQLVVDLAEPLGLGALQLAFQQLKEKLETEGLFDPARKKPLPLLPRSVGIVTSRSGAALHDILR